MKALADSRGRLSSNSNRKNATKFPKKYNFSTFQNYSDTNISMVWKKVEKLYFFVNFVAFFLLEFELNLPRLSWLFGVRAVRGRPSRLQSSMFSLFQCFFTKFKEYAVSRAICALLHSGCLPRMNFKTERISICRKVVAPRFCTFPNDGTRFAGVFNGLFGCFLCFFFGHFERKILL